MIQRTLVALCSSACLLAVPVRLLGQGNPPSWSNIRSTLRIGANEGDQIVWVSNHSDQTIIVNGVTLADCENVRVSCSTHRLNIRINPGQEKMIYRVRQRYADQHFTFRYSFSWTTDGPSPAAVAPGSAVTTEPRRTAVPERRDSLVPETRDSPAPEPRDTVVATLEEAEKVIRPGVRVLIDESLKDSTSRTADTVDVSPTQLSLRVGERLDLREKLKVIARRADGSAIQGLRLRTVIEVGRESARIEGGSLVGLKAGTAVLLISPRPPEGTQGEPKGAARIVIRVLP